MDDPTAQTDEEFKRSLERGAIPNHWSDAARRRWVEPDLRPFPTRA